MLESPIVYNDFVMNDLSPDARNFVDRDWYIKIYNVTGLFGGRDVREQREVLPGQHGERSAQSFFGGKTIVLTGELRAKSLTALRQGQRAMETAFSDMMPHDLRFNLWGEQELAFRCKMNQDIDMPEEQYGMNFNRRFAISLKGDDPRVYSAFVKTYSINRIGITVQATRQYGPTLVSGQRVRQYTGSAPRVRGYLGSASIQGPTNEGTQLAWQVTEIYGPLTGPWELQSLRNDEKLRWTSNLAGGSFLEVDHKTGTIRLNGEDEEYAGFDRANSTFFPLYPGFNEMAIVPFGSGAGARAVVRWRDAY